MSMEFNLMECAVACASLIVNQNCRFLDGGSPSHVMMGAWPITILIFPPLKQPTPTFRITLDPHTSTQGNNFWGVP